jgi:SAM-dependent methyltransferase
MRKQTTLDGAYFEQLYQKDADPWKFATSDYEREKYERTVEAIGPDRVKAMLEVGCSIGVLTADLATRCDHLWATDISETALAAARRRCADRSNITFKLVNSAAASFAGSFDLIVLSEVVYYWDDSDIAAVATRISDVLQPGGRILLVHWLGDTDYPKSADEAVGALAAMLAVPVDVEVSDRTADYRLDVWRRRSPSRPTTDRLKTGSF